MISTEESEKWDVIKEEVKVEVLRNDTRKSLINSGKVSRSTHWLAIAQALNQAI